MIPQAFLSGGSTSTIAYTTSAGSTTFNSAQALLVYNPDTANVISIATSFDSEPEANVTTGVGTIVGPNQTILLKTTTQYVTGNIFISVAGASASGNVYVTPGAV